MASLKLWKESIYEYYDNGTYKVPKKGSSDYIAIRKIYDAKKNGGQPKTIKKNCKCRCSCKCEK